MGWFYSLGIVFENKHDAEISKEKFPLSHKLENGLVEDFNFYLVESTCSRFFVLQIFPKHINTNFFNNKEYLNKKVIYEIRDFIYNILHKNVVNFVFALYEFEAAEFLNEEDIVNLLNNKKIEEVWNGFPKNKNGDSNLTFLTNDEITSFTNKNFLDGLILSENQFCKLNNLNKNKFKKFKENYYWIPLADFHNKE